MDTIEIFGADRRRTNAPSGRRIAGPHALRAPETATDVAAADAAAPLTAGPHAAAPAAADPAAAPPAAPPAAAAAAPAAAAPADSAEAVALAAAPQTLEQSLKRTVDQAMDTMERKRDEAKEKAKQ